MTGDSLDSLQRDCAVIMNSDLDPDPSKFNDKEWLGPYTLDGNTIYGFISNEYQGNTHPGQCPSNDAGKCWYNAITFAKSIDKGATYTHATPPDHLVASLPYPYEPDIGPSGVFGGSNIIHNQKDGYCYGLIHLEARGLQDWGTCVMRTRTLDDSTSWRAWNGTDFSVRFVNPYTESGFDPADHVCQPVSRDNIEKMAASVTYNTFFDAFILVGAAGLGESWEGTGYGFYYSLSDDLVNWSPKRLIVKRRLFWSIGLSRDRFHYASLIDPDDTSRNFEVTGQRPYLYYMRWHDGTTLDRDLVRIPLEFSKTEVSGFIVNTPTDGGDTLAGDGICDSGSGLCSLRAAIQESNARPPLVDPKAALTIEFSVPGHVGPVPIRPRLQLPEIKAPVLIDGYTQTGARPNTNPFGLEHNAALMIEIDGSLTQDPMGLVLRAGNSTVRGLAIRNFGTAILIGPDVDPEPGPGGNVIEGNLLGFDPGGTEADDGVGVSIRRSPDNTVGGVSNAARNVILGGVGIGRAGADGNLVQGNYIGISPTGLPTPGGRGVSIDRGAENNIIGGADGRNLISASGNAFNVFIGDPGTDGNSVLGNLIGTDFTGPPSSIGVTMGTGVLHRQLVTV